MKRLVINIDVMDFETGQEMDKIIDIEYEGQLDLSLLIKQIAAATRGYVEDQEGPAMGLFPATAIKRLAIS